MHGTVEVYRGRGGAISDLGVVARRQIGRGTRVNRSGD